MKTIVGLYNSVEQANKVKSALTGEGYEAERITVIDRSSAGYTGTTTDTGYTTTNEEHESIGARIKDFFTGKDSDETAHRSYTQGVAKGGALLAVTVENDEAEETADLLQQHGASEIEGGYDRDGLYDNGRTNSYGAGSVAGTGQGEQVIPIVEEELEVGKRQVSRGGVRIYSHMVSEPVSESVTLHDERVVVDRRAVDRPATEADFNTGGGVIEVSATGEEAVVGKRSRVVEEVSVGKQATERTQEINDTLRHTEVDVEDTTAETTGTSFDRR